MGDEDAAVEYSWSSLEATAEGSDEFLSGKYVKVPGR
jgi:hypothetical protein